MDQSAKLVVCMGEGAKEEDAIALSNSVNAPVSNQPGEHLTLLLEETGLSLTGYGLTYQGDFEQMIRRVGNHLQHEMLVHVAKSKNENLKAVDATAGMGEDSFILAAYGYQVTMFEQNPVVAALLKDALRRAQNHPVIGEIVNRMTLIEGNSIELLPKQTQELDLIYLDPMFPARQKSGLIQKKLQLIQKLEQPCPEEEALLDMAMAIRPKKIIIKRPLKGSNLANRKPHYSIKGKAIRYDCFAFPR